jgi:hypothetical protein
MSLKRFATSSIITGGKSSKLWDQTTKQGDYVAIATIIVSGTSSTSLTFSNIPQTFTHLQLRYTFNSYNNAGGNSAFMALNGDGGNNYVAHYLLGAGSNPALSGGSATSTSPQFFANYPWASGCSTAYAASGVTDLFDYTSTTKNKVYRSVTGYSAGGYGIQAAWVFSGMWMATGANTNVTTWNVGIVGSGNYFIPGSQFSLYGIKAAT